MSFIPSNSHNQRTGWCKEPLVWEDIPCPEGPCKVCNQTGTLRVVKQFCNIEFQGPPNRTRCDGHSNTIKYRGKG